MQGRRLEKLKCSNPIGCHLDAIDGVGNCFFSQEGIDEFNALMKKEHGLGFDFKGKYTTGTIVSVGDNLSAFTYIVRQLTKRGFKLLGTQPGAHPENGEYKMYLFGRGFTRPGEDA